MNLIHAPCSQLNERTYRHLETYQGSLELFYRWEVNSQRHGACSTVAVQAGGEIALNGLAEYQGISHCLHVHKLDVGLTDYGPLGQENSTQKLASRPCIEGKRW